MNINLLKPWQPYKDAFQRERTYRIARRKLREDQTAVVTSRELIQRDVLTRETLSTQVSADALLFGLSARVANDPVYREQLSTVFEVPVESVKITEADGTTVNGILARYDELRRTGTLQQAQEAFDTSRRKGIYVTRPSRIYAEYGAYSIAALGLNSPEQTAALLGYQSGDTGVIRFSMIGSIGVISSATGIELRALPYRLDGQSNLNILSDPSLNPLPTPGGKLKNSNLSASIGYRDTSDLSGAARDFWLVAPDSFFNSQRTRILSLARGTRVGGKGILTVSIPEDSDRFDAIGKGKEEVDDALAYVKVLRRSGFSVDRVVFGSVIEMTPKGVVQRDAVTFVVTKIKRV